MVNAKELVATNNLIADINKKMSNELSSVGQVAGTIEVYF
jgi:hypothetical protein